MALDQPTRRRGRRAPARRSRPRHGPLQQDQTTNDRHSTSPGMARGPSRGSSRMREPSVQRDRATLGRGVANGVASPDRELDADPAVRRSARLMPPAFVGSLSLSVACCPRAINLALALLSCRPFWIRGSKASRTRCPEVLARRLHDHGDLLPALCPFAARESHGGVASRLARVAVASTRATARCDAGVTRSGGEFCQTLPSRRTRPVRLRACAGLVPRPPTPSASCRRAGACG